MNIQTNLILEQVINNCLYCNLLNCVQYTELALLKWIEQLHQQNDKHNKIRHYSKTKISFGGVNGLLFHYK